MQISQAAISTLYALLNEITRYSDEEGATVDRYSMLTKNAISGAPDANQLSEKQKQQVCANALSAIVGVAVYLKDEAVSILFVLCMGMFLISFPKDYGPGAFHAYHASQITFYFGYCIAHIPFGGSCTCQPSWCIQGYPQFVLYIEP